MNLEGQTLQSFLQKKQFRYCNPSGVIFYRLADGTFFVAAGYPGVEETSNISLDYFQEFNSISHFMSLLKITQKKFLDNIVPEDLAQLYDQELMDIVCTLKGMKAREMRFRKMGGMIWAISVRKKLHLVRTNMGHAKDFIIYTKRYYKIIGD